MFDSILGTLTSRLLDALINRGRLKVKAVAYRWEPQDAEPEHRIQFRVTNVGPQPVVLTEVGIDLLPGVLRGGTQIQMRAGMEVGARKPRFASLVIYKHDRPKIPCELKPGHFVIIEMRQTPEIIKNTVRCFARDSSDRIYRTKLKE